MNKRNVIAACRAGIVLFALVATCGCFTSDRNGQMFLSTLKDWDRVANPPTGERWIMAFVDPFVYVGCFVGMFTLGPVSDIIFLPQDFQLSCEGTDIAVVDGDMRPIPDADVKVCYHGACLSDSGTTDANGVFHTGIHFDRIAYGTASVEKSGYYPTSWIWRASGGESSPLGNFNVQTAVLSRIVRPVDLMFKSVCFSGDSKDPWGGYEKDKWRKLENAGGGARYDFVKGDWLPPFGKGEVSDVVVTPVDGRDEVRLEFSGDGNGVAVSTAVPTSGVQMRQAPVSGYEKVYMTEDSRVENQVGLYFRIRGNVFGKICRNVRVYVSLGDGYYNKKLNRYVYARTEEEKLIRVSFDYYLNPTPGDRNLEQRKPYAYWQKLRSMERNSGSVEP